MFKGSLVALVTPWKNNSLDEVSFVNLVKWHNESGTTALIVCGSTGEGIILTENERELVIKLALENAKIPVIAACGSPSTQEVINQAQHAEKLESHALLVVAPPYARTTQEGLYQHFKAVHDATNIPIILYNNPGRTVTEITVPTAMRLFDLERIIGIKDSTNDLSRAAQMRMLQKKNLCLLSGDDPYLAGYLAQGGDGVISVTANAKPKEMADLLKAWENKNIELFHQLNVQLMKLHCALGSCEPNPIPIKAAMEILGKCTKEVRLPLVEASAETVTKLKAAL
jgi:4-hydroxy-tetrahydrodipicolinate synthase